MPRRARLSLPGVPCHVIQRGNNRGPCFFVDADYRRFLDILHDQAEAHGCRVHAYVLMSNHVHLLLTPAREESTAGLMKNLGQRYVQYVNRSHGRTGTLWEGRFRSCLAQDDAYVLACSRYIEMNPVRAGMVRRPSDYPWSSFRANGQGAADPIVTPHADYLRLGSDGCARRAAYRALFRGGMPAALLDEIRRATNGGYVLGDDRFKAELTERLGRRVIPGTPGRPKKAGKARDDAV